MTGLLWSTFYANLQARATSILKTNFKKLWKKNKNVLHTEMQGYYSKFKHWNLRNTEYAYLEELAALHEHFLFINPWKSTTKSISNIYIFGDTQLFPLKNSPFWQQNITKSRKSLWLCQNVWYNEVKCFWKLMISFC